MSNTPPEEKRVSFAIPSPDFLSETLGESKPETTEFYSNYGSQGAFQPFPTYQQYHNSSSSLSSVMSTLPPSSQSFACPSYVSDYYYDNLPTYPNQEHQIQYRPHIQHQHQHQQHQQHQHQQHQHFQEQKYSSVPIVPVSAPPMRSRAPLSGRSSAPPRILSEPPYPTSQQFFAPPQAPRCATPSLPLFDPSDTLSSHSNFSYLSNTKTDITQTISPTLTENESQVIYKELCNPFTQRILCFFSSDGAVPLVCDICKKTTNLEVCKGKNAEMACGHYIACNECRGRTVRRLLRCVACCKELTSGFPVCGTSCVDVTSNKEPSNTGSCPRCDKKLRREVCGSSCDRRKSDNYSELRNQLNDKVAIMVLNPKDCLNYSHNGIWRPCSHYSYCAEHHVICKGHGKDITCRFCKGNKKLKKRRQSLNLDPPSKRSCVRPQ